MGRFVIGASSATVVATHALERIKVLEKQDQQCRCIQGEEFGETLPKILIFKPHAIEWAESLTTHESYKGGESF